MSGNLSWQGRLAMLSVLIKEKYLDATISCTQIPLATLSSCTMPVALQSEKRFPPVSQMMMKAARINSVRLLLVLFGYPALLFYVECYMLQDQINRDMRLRCSMHHPT